jgi:hypothetical protein
MQFLRLIAVLAIALGALVFSSVTAVAKPSPSHAAVPTTGPITHDVENQAVSKVARAQFLAWQLGKIDRARYTDVLSQLITDEKVATSSQGLSRLGPLQKLEYVGVTGVEGLPPDNKTYLYHMICGAGAVYMQFSLTPTGKISSMLFRDKLDPDTSQQ